MFDAILAEEVFFSFNGFLFLVISAFITYGSSIILKQIFINFIFKYDTKRRDSIIKSMDIFIFVCFLAFILAKFTGNSAIIVKAILVLLAFKLLYHFTRNTIIELYGKEVELDVEVKNKRKKDELQVLLDKKTEINTSSKIDVNKEYFYKTTDEKFYSKKIVHVSTKATSLLEVGLLIFYSIFTATVIIDILEPLHSVFKSSFTIPAIAFLGAYVFNPAFSDMYAFITFVKNKNIDLEKFIRFKDGSDVIKGRIISMNTSHLIIKDHVLGITKTVPNRDLIGKIIENLSNIENKLGIKHVLEYVLGYDLYKEDYGEKIKEVFKTILSDFETETTSISKQDEYNVWITPDNDGIKVILWYFVTDIEEEEKIRLNIEDFILQEATKYDFDLRTPKLVELVKPSQ